MSNATSSSADITLSQVKEYYGETLKSSNDLQTTACCSTANIPRQHKEILSLIDDEILTRFYGCGSPMPPVLDGCTILDLGCGTGRDVFLSAALAGPKGHVIGVDMTDEQLSVARRHAPAQLQTLGLSESNVTFHKGYIEDLAAIGIEDDSVDVVISNCVINLSPDKGRVIKEIFRVLKPGGELYFSDVFADRRIPDAVRNDPVLYGECLSGALYIEDFRRLLASVGCMDYRVTETSPIAVTNEELAAKVGLIQFTSKTIRAFKLASLEDICEDYGQVATYHGTITEAAHSFDLDDHHRFVTGKPMLVCGNTAAMLQETRYADHFTIVGDRAIHFGVFDCTDSNVAPMMTGASGCC